MRRTWLCKTMLQMRPGYARPCNRWEGPGCARPCYRWDGPGWARLNYIWDLAVQDHAIGEKDLAVHDHATGETWLCKTMLQVRRTWLCKTMLQVDVRMQGNARVGEEVSNGEARHIFARWNIEGWNNKNICRKISVSFSIFLSLDTKNKIKPKYLYLQDILNLVFRSL